ncbi:MAG TPA: hypothetical protein VFM58_24005 [Solirubrobacteraceae bacterium]|nr:hypothetical protein [Solirubrobacteraceae bacterium]
MFAATRSLVLLVVVLAVSGCGGGAPAAAPAPDAANLWVAPTAGAKPERCATPCTFDPAKAYGDFQAAYSAAANGDTVRVKAGRYGTQAIATTNPDLSEPVTIRAAHGEDVTLTLLQTDADWLSVKDMTIEAGAAAGRGWRSTGSHITLANVDITGPEATISLAGGGADVTYRDSALGTRGNTTRRLCANHNPEPLEVADTTRLTIYNVTFWPFVPELDNLADCGGDGNLHLETIRVNDGVKDLVINRARFMAGDESGSARLFQSGAGGAPSSGGLVVNSYFGPAIGLDIQLAAGDATCDGWVFAYNSWTHGINDEECAVKPTYVGNLGPQPDYLPCPGSRASHNLWAWTAPKSGCGTDAWVVHPEPVTDAYAQAADGYHLTPGSPAIDAGEQELCAKYTGGEDIDGDRRSGTCDAGPDEYVP